MIDGKTGDTHGYESSTWERAKLEAIRAIIAQATGGRSPTISYSDLSKRINSIHFDPHDFRFHLLLYEISHEEDAAGRGLISALVVHKDDGRPGQGFWDMAKEHERDVTDMERCWSDEVSKVLNHCQNHPLCASAHMSDLDEQVMAIIEEYENQPEYVTVDVVQRRIPRVDRVLIEEAIARLRSAGRVVKIRF